jgi:ABC-type ATPase involved in cell division
LAPGCPCCPSPACPIFGGEQSRDSVAHLCPAPDIVLADRPTFVEWPGLASGPCNPEG